LTDLKDNTIFNTNNLQTKGPEGEPENRNRKIDENEDSIWR
jgi:hypothetical protein